MGKIQDRFTKKRKDAKKPDYIRDCCCNCTHEPDTHFNGGLIVKDKEDNFLVKLCPECFRMIMVYIKPSQGFWAELPSMADSEGSLKLTMKILAECDKEQSNYLTVDFLPKTFEEWAECDLYEAPLEQQQKLIEEFKDESLRHGNTL